MMSAAPDCTCPPGYQANGWRNFDGCPIHTEENRLRGLQTLESGNEGDIRGSLAFVLQAKCGGRAGLTGEVMRHLQGKANPVAVARAVDQLFDSLRPLREGDRARLYGRWPCRVERVWGPELGPYADVTVNGVFHGGVALSDLLREELH